MPPKKSIKGKIVSLLLVVDDPTDPKKLLEIDECGGRPSAALYIDDFERWCPCDEREYELDWDEAQAVVLVWHGKKMWMGSSRLGAVMPCGIDMTLKAAVLPFTLLTEGYSDMEVLAISAEQLGYGTVLCLDKHDRVPEWTHGLSTKEILGRHHCEFSE